MNRDRVIVCGDVPSAPTESTKGVIASIAGAEACPTGLVIFNCRGSGLRSWDGFLTVFHGAVDHGWIAFEITLLAKPFPSGDLVFCENGSDFIFCCFTETIYILLVSVPTFGLGTTDMRDLALPDV